MLPEGGWQVSVPRCELPMLPTKHGQCYQKAGGKSLSHIVNYPCCRHNIHNVTRRRVISLCPTMWITHIAGTMCTMLPEGRWRVTVQRSELPMLPTQHVQMSRLLQWFCTVVVLWLCIDRSTYQCNSEIRLMSMLHCSSQNRLSGYLCCLNIYEWLFINIQVV